MVQIYYFLYLWRNKGMTNDIITKYPSNPKMVFESLLVVEEDELLSNEEADEDNK